MLTKTIEFTDFNGEQRKEKFEFHLSEAEVVELNLRYVGGLEKYVESLNHVLDGNKVMDMFRDLLERTVGRRTPDGRFEKSKEVRDQFMYSAAYDVMFMELCTDADAATKFTKGIMPAKIKAQQQLEDKKKNGGNYTPPTS